jgi:class I fructose-bisphosphate aldolase
MSGITETVRKIINYYESDTPGVKSNLARVLNHGSLSGTGKLVILPVDQGFEHGPVRSFSMNKPAFDPHYHYQLAIDSSVSAYAAPLGALEAGASTFSGQIPTILKMNSGNTLATPLVGPDQAVTASIQDALRLGCSGIGFTIYPGSSVTYEMYEEIQDLSSEAKDCGLFTVIWSYPRGSISKEGETAIDTISYGAHMAALLGAHIIKVKLPTNYVESPEAKKAYLENNIPISTLKDRVAHVMQCCFAGRRIVVFSGGATQTIEKVYEEAHAIRDGGGNGSIIGRNSFQRSYKESVDMLKKLNDIYKK